MFWLFWIILTIVWESFEPRKSIKDSDALIIVHQPNHVEHDSRLITYSSQDLKQIGRQYLTSKRHYPDFRTLRIIKDLKINARRLRLQKWRKILARRANLQNLHQIPVDASNSITSNKKLCFGTVNVRSLKNTINHLMEILSRENLDFIVITETWLKDNSDSWLNAQGLNDLGYNHDSVPRSDGRRGGGILLIYKSTYKLVSSQSTTLEYCESRLWKLTSGKKTFSCLGVYHPPSASNQVNDSIFTDSFLDATSLLLAEHNDLIIMGDFNIHVNDVSDNDAIFFLEAMSSLGLKQHVQSATHVGGNTIDLIFTEPESIPVTTCICADLLSDHRIVICQTDLNNPVATKAEIKVRKYSEENVTQFGKCLDISPVMNCCDLEEAVKEYEEILTSTLNDCMPLKTKKVTVRKRVPWYTSDIKHQKQILRNRERSWLKYGEHHQWLAYKRERNRYRNMITYSKSCFLTREINKAKGDTKKLYQLANNFTSNVTENPMPTGHSNAEQSQIFADFFLEKIEKIREMFVDIQQFDLQVRTGIPAFRKFAPLSQSEVGSIISNMKTKSCELDPIPTHLLKSEHVLPTLLPAITKIVNLSLSQGDFSERWKCAIVRPLLKKQNLELVEKNYRPVSNLQFLSKVVERATLLQFNDHCLSYKLIPDYQSAYREGYSCETVVIKLMNDILWAMESQNVTPCVLLDLSAAFNTVDHDLLLRVLDLRYSICDTALQWYDHYLRPREFKVCVGGEYSDPKNLSFSVPQGSASGANIFVAYCESLLSVIPPTVHLKGFADDHLTHKSFKASNRQAEINTIQTLEQTFHNIKSWMDGMRLKLNPSKTEFIIFGNQVQLNKLTTTQFDACGDLINKSDKVKVLGTVLDSNLKMLDHVNAKVKCAMFNFRRIREIRKYLSVDTCKVLVLSLVMSHLDYNNAALVGISDYVIHKFQRIQNMCAKLVLNRKKYDSVTEALKYLHWLPVKLRIEHKLLCITHKCIHGTGPEYLKDLLVRNTGGSRSTRSQEAMEKTITLIVPRTKLKTFAARSFSVKSPEMWNNLPCDVRVIENYELFKSRIKNILFDRF